MRIFVTGGAGFVGSHTVDLLLSEGLDVVVLDNLDPQVHAGDDGYPVHLGRHRENAHFKFVKGDVRDKDVMAHAMRGADAVLHLAAAVGVGQSMYEPLYYSDVNVTGTATLLQAIVGATPRPKRMVLASSMSIYGEGPYACDSCKEKYVHALDHRPSIDRWEPVCPTCHVRLISVPTDEGKPLQPTSIYAITKKVQEEMALCFGRAYHLPTVALRYFNIFGSRQAMNNPYTGVMAIFLSRLLNGKPPLIFEDGLQSRDFVHVRDIARANLHALTSDQADCTAVNVGTGRAMTILALARLLADELGVAIEPEVSNRVRAGDVRHCYADISEIRQRFGWEPRMSRREGIRDLVAWAGRQRPLDRVEEAVAELAQQGLVR